MKTTVQKWGNSLAVRLPKSIASEVGFEPDTPVEVTAVDGKVIVSSARRPRRTLAEMVARITDENRHEEIDFGPAVGKEVW